MTLARTPQVALVLPLCYPPGRNGIPISSLIAMRQFSCPICITSIVEIVVTIVLRIVIIVLFHAMVIIIIIVLVLFIIISTIVCINSA